MKSLTETYFIKSSIKDVWEALVDPHMIDLWGGGVAQMDDQVGTKFSLWDGDVYGTNTEVIKEKKLVQDWYGGHWKEPSKVIFTLIPKGDEVELTLIHTNIPDNEFDDIEDGWKQYYLGPIKELLEK